ncbi:nucleotidyl transferase, partial [Candidatus Woesearchaeota archaeon]|nr:nucleotidyl transferase [Candidatus Woesearchaeota archaeon]
GKPNIDHILDLLKDLDISEYIFITGHLKDYVEEYITKKGIKARFIEQEVKDGTAGAVRLAEPYVDEDMFIIFVDTIFDTDLSILKTNKDDGIIWCQEVEDYQRFGIVTHDKDGYMTDIVEKPDKPIGNLANIGLYYIKDYKLLFEGIKHVYDQDLKVKGEYYLPEVFMYMIEHGAKIKVLPVKGWYDCGKPETTLESNAALLPRYHEVKSKGTNTKILEPVFIDSDCTISDSEIGPNVHLSKGCTVKNAKLHDCIIDENSTVQDISLGDSILGTNTFLEGEGTDKKYTMRIGCHSHTSLKPKK